MKKLILAMIAVFSMSVVAIADHHEGHKTDAAADAPKAEAPKEKKAAKKKKKAKAKAAEHHMEEKAQ